MIKTLTAFSFIFISMDLHAAPKYEMRGYLSSKVMKYTNKAKESSGQRYRAQIEHLANYSESVSLLNQARWNYSSVYQDLSPNIVLSKEDTHQFYAGENFLKVQSSDFVIQLGYQEISWGEAFGFNYADLINPEDQTETLYADASESKLPLLLFNTKYFFTNGSLQFLYSPEPKFSRMLPLSLFTSAIIPGIEFNVVKESSPTVFKEHEWGGKISYTKAGFDLSAFTYSSLDRTPHYSLVSATTTLITVREKHSRLKSYGAGMAKTLLDDFVLRTDVVYHQDRSFNTVSSSPFGPILSVIQSDEIDYSISIDTPTYSQFSGAMVFANSSVKDAHGQLFRVKDERYAIGKISYDFENEKTLDLSYTHELAKHGHAVQGQFNWAINDHFDFRFGGEFYWGDSASNFGRTKKMSNIFFSIKNYFQL